jgi:tRNA(Met) cytidine acetyltransferase
MVLKELRRAVMKATEASINKRHRFMVFLCGEMNRDMLRLSQEVFEIYFQTRGAIKGENFKGLLLAGRTKFLEFIEAGFFNSESYKSRKIHFKDSERVLGETYGSLILDLTEGFSPNDIGILVETVEEGGIIIVLSSKPEEWSFKLSKWHEELVSEPYTKDSVIPRFYRRFMKQTEMMDGIIIYDADSSRILKEFTPSREKTDRREIEIPESKKIKRKLYKLCATQDQVEVLRAFESFFDWKEDKEKKVAVITADRGRGKTAVLGILTPFLISRMQRVLKRPVRIMIVAQTPQSIQTYFRFLKLSLTRQGFSDCRFKESGGLVTVVTGRHLRIEYVVPRRAIVEARYADVVLVDEAASIDVSTLFKIVEDVKYAIFSSTIHGYEGSGRGFSVRFLKRIESDEKVEVERINLEEPIRYARGDPIEKWLYKTLLLDSKPVQLDEDDLERIREGKLKFEFLDKDKLIEDEELLYEFFGIYVLAHYRNRPSDLVILFDMPNHLAFRVSVNGKTVCSLHVAIEGGLSEDLIKEMSEGYKPKGQIIPDMVLKHHWDTEFPKMKGLRIVRIATHPDVMGMGIGSFALIKLINWAKRRKYEWVGSGFGVSPELLSFWNRGGFIPLHITPQRNEISGEFTVVVVKGLNKKMDKKISKLNFHFVKRVIEYLSDELRDLEYEVVKRLLELKSSDTPPKPQLSEIDVARMEKYLEGISLYEYISDVARPVVRFHYLNRERAELNDIEEKVLIEKCLQLKGWWEFGELLREGRAYSILHSAISKVWRWFRVME